ncbi:NYN domain-containing protein [Nonomuraea guangzhouensis]|uniref:NYN domain-containing protein n=1 Tax=Nonomuraea guangzhouensis TaxID=1291555 RepID=A0ABW4GDE4_9ACTN|nr:NYN domain-containing protein [Nonomuraea guangzhouensis]
MDVVAYVDGFNLYHGLKSKYGRAYLWLDLVELIRRIRRHDTVIKVRYFTAIVKGEPDAALRQETYLSALAANSPEVEIIRGHFKKKTARCRDCGARWTCECDPPQTFHTFEEKLTDVALAVAMTMDAASGYGDMSVLVSTDTDFRPAVEASLQLAPARPILIACPPGRVGPKHDFSGQVIAFAIPEEHLEASLLPDEVTGPDRRTYKRPDKWSG